MENQKLRISKKNCIHLQQIPYFGKANIDYNIQIFHPSIKILFLSSNICNIFLGVLHIWSKILSISYFLHFGDSFGEAVGAKN